MAVVFGLKPLLKKKYVDAIRNNTITFGIGPAGTGKTYLAMAMAVAALNDKQVSRIVLTRPVVEAGENLGFLPGTLTEKIDPYIRPLYDALYELMDSARATRYINDNTIEIAPLAFMRGRTLNDASLFWMRRKYHSSADENVSYSFGAWVQDGSNGRYHSDRPS